MPIAPHTRNENWNQLEHLQQEFRDIAPHTRSENWNNGMKDDKWASILALHAGSENWNIQLIDCHFFASLIAPNAGSENWNRDLEQSNSDLLDRFSRRGARIEIVVRLHISTIAPIAPHARGENWNQSRHLMTSVKSYRSPHRERELKSLSGSVLRCRANRSSRRRARIEMLLHSFYIDTMLIAPHAGSMNWNAEYAITSPVCQRPRIEKW